MIGNQNIEKRVEKENDRQEGKCLIFDTHAHYDDAQFDGDRDEILENLSRYGIGNVVDVGAGLKSTEQAIALAKKYPFVYAAAGVHPTQTGGLTEQDFSGLVSQMEEEKVVAVGEIGLDHYWEKAPGYHCPRDIQQYWFGRQLDLAVEKDLPVIIHSRDAAADTLSLIRKAYGQAEAGKKRLTGVIHCFSYGEELAAEYVKMGFFIGIGGVVTFKNARKTKEVVLKTALEQIVLETDCPYLAPEPHRGERNSSCNLPLVAQEIARIKGITAGEVICATDRNARRLYRLADDAQA